MSSAAGKLRLCLPKTKFPLRVNPAIHEPAIQKAAKFEELYQWQRNHLQGGGGGGGEQGSPKSFTLHDGPPYANGIPHMGHVLNKVLKDIINRYKLMRGYRLSYTPGWDCHGLPIELKACKGMDAGVATPSEIRSRAAEFARKTLQSQREEFKRWGCLGDWEHPYVTMDPDYEANQISVFYQMYKKGCIYRGFKPVFWSPSTRTALAEAELEYRDHTSRAVYVLFPISKPPPPVVRGDWGGGGSVGGHGKDVYALVWTTTPWTLVANKAICFNPSHQYSLVRVDGDTGASSLLLFGSESVPRLSSLLGSFEVVATFSGAELEGTEYVNSLDESGGSRPFLPGSHVVETEGTGLVHTAPAHGMEDYGIGMEHKLDLQCHVDDLGKYTSEVGREFEGLFVLKEGNDKVVSTLKSNGCLFHEHSHSHRYPYDWRSKKPVILRSTEQWFASVRDLKEEAKAALSGVTMHPSTSANRILSMLDMRDDWCISRQRVWGVPLPIFYHKDTGRPLLNDETIDHIRELFRTHGSDCWWEKPLEELLPESLRGEAGNYERGWDTMDVWFDSGSSWATVLSEEGEADMYLEGSDQHRGWFQSSLLTSVAARGTAPYKAVVTHGFVLDGNGNKMSKSLGNVINPSDIIDSKNFGVDVMRLWVASSTFTADVSISNDILKQTNDNLQKIRNTCRFMLGNLSDFNPSSHIVSYPELSLLDRYLLHLLHRYCSEATMAYESLSFSRFHHLLMHMVPIELSAFYFDVIKDRLYCDSAEGKARRSTQTALHHLLRCFSQSVAPVLPHLAEEIAQHYPFEGGSVFKGGWLHCPTQWDQPSLFTEFSTMRSIRDICNKALEIARVEKAIRSSLEAQVIIRSSDKLSTVLERHSCNGSDSNSSVDFSLENILLVSRVELDSGSQSQPRISGYSVEGEVEVCGEPCAVGVTVRPVSEDGGVHKCRRCWKFTSTAPGCLCQRCQEVMDDYV